MGNTSTHPRTIKMKPAGVQSGTYIDYDVKDKDKDPKFNADDHVRISKYKNNNLWKRAAKDKPKRIQN